MVGLRWVIGIGALLVALVAIYVLFIGEPARETGPAEELTRPALDDIDDESRKALRDLLRQDENGE